MAKLSTKQGSTRGKNPRKIEYEVFDREQPDTLPKTIEEFKSVSGVTKDDEILDLLIEGYNDSSYSKASDEIGEFINDVWSAEVQNQFRLAVRNFSKLTGKSIEEVANMVRPATDAAWNAKAAASAAAKEVENTTEPTAVPA